MVERYEKKYMPVRTTYQEVTFYIADWRRAVPSFHRADGNGQDPPPDAAPWRSHVLCEHGQLNADASERVLITNEVRNCSDVPNRYLGLS